MNTLYQVRLMDHYKFPRNRRTVEHADFTVVQEQRSCGDRITFSARICPVTQQFVDLGFDGEGCVLSQAVASLMSEEYRGKPITDILVADDVSYVEQLVGSSLGPVRIRCALLSIIALRHGVMAYQKK